jgi:hypothetical protein
MNPDDPRYSDDAIDETNGTEEWPDEYDGDECYECGGEGIVLDDCFEDTCCCADPETEHDMVPCPVCQP